MLDIIIPLLDNATCSVIMIVVLWRFDSTVRLMAQLQQTLNKELLDVLSDIARDREEVKKS